MLLPVAPKQRDNPAKLANVIILVVRISIIISIIIKTEITIIAINY